MRWIANCGSFIALTLTACQAPVGVAGANSVPKDGAAQCADVCHQMGTTLADIVVMANNVGCVCEPRGAAPASPTGAAGPGTPTARYAAAAAGGLAAVVMAEQQQAQSNYNH
jgi:hypothetical protein